MTETPINEGDTKPCPFCGETIKAVAKKCRFCGEMLDGSVVPSDGNKPDASIQVVVKSEQVVTPCAPPPPIYPKSRTAFIVLAILLGPLGVHNFYAGYNLRGGMQLAMTIFLGWFVVPLIAVYIWILLEILFVREDERCVRMA